VGLRPNWLAHRSGRQYLRLPGHLKFLTLLESNDTVRADAFRQLYERGGKDALLDSLHDLEAEPIIRGWLLNA
jgi:hypothetical protein